MILKAYGEIRKVVQHAPAPINRPIRKFVDISLRAVIESAMKSPRRAARIYKSYRYLSKKMGLSDRLIAISDRISFEQNAHGLAIRALTFLFLLSAKKPIWRRDFTIEALSLSDDETQLLLDLIEQSINNQKDEPALMEREVKALILASGVCDDGCLDHARFIISDGLQAVERQKIKSSHYQKLRSEAPDLLADLRQAFDKAGGRYFLLSGTLLGAVREKEIITGDVDIDLGVFTNETSIDQLKKTILPLGLRVEREFDHEIAFCSPSGVLVEFFLCERTDSAVIVRSYGNTHVWKFSRFELVEMEFLGTLQWVPENTEVNLQENFGDWQSSVKLYDWTSDPPCVIPQNNAENAYYNLQALSKSINSGQRYEADLAFNSLRKNFSFDLSAISPEHNREKES